MTLFARQVQQDISGDISGSGRIAGADGNGGSWASAAAFGVGNSLLTVALSCLTDLHCRRGFLRQEREQERARQQEVHGQEQRARRGGSEGCKWEEEQ